MSPRFYTYEETYNFLSKDVDGYVEKMTEQDLLSQKSKSKKDFIKNITNAIDDFTLEEKIKCYLATVKADKFLKKIKIDGIDSEKLSKMKWNLALTRGSAYEEGLPHTRRDVIFISDQVIALPIDDLTRTLVHEKVHVYERLYPQDIEKWMTKVGFKKFKRQSEYENVRSNPDVDGWVYLDPKGRETVVLFRNENPSHLDDVIYPFGHDASSEHPYETLAYLIDTMFGKQLENTKLGFHNSYVDQF